MTAARVEKEGELFYVLILGVYESETIARDASAELPDALVGTQPWIRKLGSLQTAHLPSQHEAEVIAGPTPTGQPKYLSMAYEPAMRQVNNPMKPGSARSMKQVKRGIVSGMMSWLVHRCPCDCLGNRTRSRLLSPLQMQHLRTPPQTRSQPPIPRILRVDVRRY